MNRIIKEKWGVQYLKGLQIEAVKKFVINNPDRVFEYERCDFEFRYVSVKIYDEMMKKTDDDYCRIYKYRVDFRYKKENDRFSGAEANFIVDKIGKVSKIKVELTLKEKKNYIYSAYLSESLKNFISKSIRKFATHKGVSVISKMSLLIFYK